MKFGMGILFCLCVPISVMAFEQPEFIAWRTPLDGVLSKNHKPTEFELSFCIDALEKGNNLNHMEIYLERAKIYNDKMEYEKALIDLDKILSKDNLNDEIRFSALLNRMLANLSLERWDEYYRDAKFNRETNPFLPKVVLTDSHFIITNLIDSSETREAIRFFYVNMGLCDSEEDISFNNDGTCRIKRAQLRCATHVLGQYESFQHCLRDENAIKSDFEAVSRNMDIPQVIENLQVDF